MNFIKTIKFWFINARYHALVQSFWAAMVAICIALNNENFNLINALLALIGILFAHLSINLLDDYFDYKLGSVEKRKELKGNIRSGKCNYLENGKTTTKELFACASCFGLIALLIGFYLFLQTGMPVIFITLIALILGYFYSAPPFKLSYKGFGEIIVGLIFGPLLMNGVYYCATNTFDFQLMLISFAIAPLVINILYVHSIMDEKADKAVNKNTLAVILKNKTLKLIALVFFAIYPYWIIMTGIFEYNLPKLLLFTFLTIPLTFVLIKFMIEFMNEKLKTHQPKFWMGKMEQWERIKSIGIDWFMIRWFLARNIMTFFSIIICSAYIVTALN